MSDQILVSKTMLKNLAQHAADTSAMFMPLSDFAMIGAAMLAKQAGELLGEDIQPSESAYNGTVNMVSRIRGEADKAIEKLSKDLDELRLTHAMCPIEIPEPDFDNMTFGDLAEYLDMSAEEAEKYDRLSLLEMARKS